MSRPVAALLVALLLQAAAAIGPGARTAGAHAVIDTRVMGRRIAKANEQYHRALAVVEGEHFTEARALLAMCRPAYVDARLPAAAAWCDSWTAYCFEREGHWERALEARLSALHGFQLAFGVHARLETATALRYAGARLLSSGRHVAAVAAYERCLDILERLGPPDRETLCGALRGLALSVVEVGRPDLAPTIHRRLDIAPGADLVGVLEEVAKRLDDTGHRDHSVRCEAESLTVRARLPDPIPDGSYERVTVRAVALMEEGRHEFAIPLLESLVAAGRHPTTAGDPALAYPLTTLAHACMHVERHPDALRLHREALALRERHDATGADLAFSLHGIGACLNQTLQHREAEPYLRRALALRSACYPDTHHLVAQTRNSLAVCLLEQGRHAQAVQVLDEVVEGYRRQFPRGGEPLAASLTNLGRALEGVGRIKEALSAQRESMEMHRALFGEGHQRVALGHHNIAVLLLTLGRTEEAHRHLRKAYALRKELYGPEHTDTAFSASELALSYLRLDRREEALPLLEQACSTLERLHGPDHESLGYAYGCLATHHLTSDGFEQALPYAERAHSIAMRGRSARTRPHWTGGLLGLVLLALERPEEALGPLGDAIEHVEASRRDAQALGSAGVALLFRHLRQADPYEFQALALASLGRSADTLETLDRSRARQLLDLLERSEHDPLEQARERARQAEDEERLREIEDAIERVKVCEHDVNQGRYDLQVAQGRRDLPVSEQRAEVDGAVAELGIRRRKLEESLVRRRRLEQEEVGLAAHGAGVDPRARLSDGEALLVYWLTEYGGALLLVPPGEAEIEAWPLTTSDSDEALSPEAVRDAVHAYLDKLVQIGMTVRKPLGASIPSTAHQRSQAVAEGDALFDLLVPAEAWGRIRSLDRVYLVPHGPLHRLPFEALVAGRDEKGEPRYWLDDGPPIAYTPSASTLDWCRARRDEQLGQRGSLHVVALGDPVFTRAGRPAALRAEPRSERFGGLSPLEGTRREVDAIAKAFASRAEDGATVTALLREEATEPRLFQEAARARYLHLSTHGLADETEAASYSALALTLPEAPTLEDDGFLKLLDLFEHWRGRLRNCELVVLSACETQRGRLQKDEGVFALPWGFHYAGCPSVIASQWSVSDHRTAELMAAFYERLCAGDGTDKLGHFTEARKELRARCPDPFHWAPFIYMGDPR